MIYYSLVNKEDDTPEMIMARAVMVAQSTIKRNEERILQLENETTALISVNETLVEKIEEDEEKVSYPLEEEVEEELGFKNEILEDVIETEKESNFENDSFDEETEESVIASSFENESSEEHEDEEEEDE